MQSPNILLIISDQMTPFLTGAYGHPVVQTPNLNRLTEDGVRFDAAYTPCPICAPARACLMTGTYTSVNGCYDNAAPLPSDIPTFAHYLSNAGYDTLLNGKMHFVGPDQLHGFSRRLTTDIYPSDFRWVKPEWIKTKESQGEDYQEIMGHRNSYHSRNYTGDGIKVGVWNNALSYDEETHFRTLEYLHAVGTQRDRQPFLLCASYHHPHEAFWPPTEYWNRYDGAQIDIPRFPENLEDTYSIMDKWLNAYHGTKRNNLRDPEGLYRLRRAYYALVSYMDDKVGQLLDALTENNLRDDTIVIFISDHGDMLCEKEMVQKRTFYEWSSRVPFIVRFPDGYQAGTVREQPVSLIDLLPTICDMAGIEDRLPCDGLSLMPLIDGSESGKRVVFSEMHSEAMGAPCFMVRSDQYKYVYIHGHESQLFDLSEDPGEWHNLAGNREYQAVEDQLKRRIFEGFDPDTIAHRTLESLHRRQLIKNTMEINRTTWNHAPTFDPSKNALAQYLPARR